MRILVLHGSPRNGNTLRLTHKFEEAMKEYGKVDFQYISISDLNIRFCRGCFTCVTKGESLCPLRDDDVMLIIEKMDQADGVVFSAPTYMYSIPAVMKNLVDRLAYLGHRPRYVGKHAVVISTTCEVGLKEALKYLSLGTAWAWGFHLVGKLGAQTHPFFLDLKRMKDREKNTRNLAGKFYKSISSTRLQTVGFEEIMRFRAMSKHSLYSKEIFSADYNFYEPDQKDGKNYFITPVRIRPLANAASKLLSFYVGRAMKKSRQKADKGRLFFE